MRLGVYFGTRPPAAGPPTSAVASTADKSALLAVLPGDHVLGDPKASVTLIEYASLTCPHCAHFSTQILPEVKKKWIDTGKVKLIYRDFPLDQVAAKAAQIAECAGKDRYFGVIDLIFSNQQSWATASDPIADLAKPLRIAGLGESEIKACLANEAMSNAVIADYKTAARRWASTRRRRSSSTVNSIPARARSRNSTACSASSSNRQQSGVV